MAKNDNALGYGANSWLNLPNSLLSAEGKRLVTEDPDLSAQTIEMLRKLEPTEAERFGSYYFSEEGNTSDIGLATLSMCIRDNPSATMAELVARYADLRNIPFAHVATVLSHVRYSTGFVRYVHDRIDGTHRQIPWAPAEIPKTVTLLPPPKKRKSV